MLELLKSSRTGSGKARTCPTLALTKSSWGERAGIQVSFDTLHGTSGRERTGCMALSPDRSGRGKVTSDKTLPVPALDEELS